MGIEMLNICYLCDEYPPVAVGGIGRMVHSFAKTISKMGHNVVVAGLYDREDASETEGVKIIRAKRTKAGPLRLPRNLYILRKVARRLLIDDGVEQWTRFTVGSEENSERTAPNGLARFVYVDKSIPDVNGITVTNVKIKYLGEILNEDTEEYFVATNGTLQLTYNL